MQNNRNHVVLNPKAIDFEPKHVELQADTTPKEKFDLSSLLRGLQPAVMFLPL